MISNLGKGYSKINSTKDWRLHLYFNIFFEALIAVQQLILILISYYWINDIA